MGARRATRPRTSVIALMVVYEDRPLLAQSGAHDFHELVYHVDGRYETRVEGRLLNEGPGGVYYYPPGLFHDIRLVRGPLYVLQWQEADSATPRAARPRCLYDATGRIFLVLTWMMDLFPSHSRQDRRILDLLLEALLHSLEALAAPGESDVMRRARRYLTYHAHLPLRLEAVAEAAGVSKYHLIRRFRRALGVTPMRYLRKLRAEAALQLLCNSELPAKTIAARVGLSSASHLTHLLRRELGHSPSELRKARRRGSGHFTSH